MSLPGADDRTCDLSLQRWNAWSPQERGHQRRALPGVIVLSDFQDVHESTHRELRRIASHGHDVAMLQVVAPDESAFPYRGDLEFEDLETGEKRLIDAGAIAAEYRTAFATFVQQSRENAVRDNVDYALMRTDAPPGEALRDVLMRRGAKPGAHTPGSRSFS